MIEKLYTVEEVAQLASVTGRTIRNYLKSGRLVGRKIGGQWRFPESEVQRLLSGGEAMDESTPAPGEAEYPSAAAEPAVGVYNAPASQPLPKQPSPVITTPAASSIQSQPVPRPQPLVADSTPDAYAPPAPVPEYGYSQSAAHKAPVASKPMPSGSPGSYNAPAPLPTTGAPPPPTTASQGRLYGEAPGAYSAEPYNESYDYEPSQAPKTTVEPPEAQAPADQAMPPVSEVGLKVLQFVAEVHDCSAGPQTCTVIEVIQPLPLAKATVAQLATLAKQESGGGIPCECYVEYDERFSVARYTLFGSAPYLMQALQLIA